MNAVLDRKEFRKRGAIALAIGAMLFAAPRPTTAEPILALTTANALLSFDSATPGTTSSVTISGFGAESIVGIDVRPQPVRSTPLAARATST